MGVTTDLDRQPWRETGITLAQIYPGPLRQADQQVPGLLVKAGVRRMGDILFHNRRINRHPLQTVARGGRDSCNDGVD